MKRQYFLITMSLMIMAVSCGPQVKKKTKYVENPFDNSANDTRLTNLEARVNQLETDFATAQTVATNLAQSVQDQAEALNLSQAQLDTLEAEYDNSVLQGMAAYTQLQTDIANLQAGLNTANATIDSVQTQANGIQEELTALSENLDSEERVVGYLDPCGDAAGQYDEVLMVTNTGKVVAYFESGSNRFLSVLVANTTYQTTDSQHCVFSVSATGTLN